MSERVNHPAHYGGADNPYEAIKVIEAWGLGFCLGNTVKYLSRAGKKDPAKTIEDLEKSAWYLEREVNATDPVVCRFPFPTDYNPFSVSHAWELPKGLSCVLVEIVSCMSAKRSGRKHLKHGLAVLREEIERRKADAAGQAVIHHTV